MGCEEYETQDEARFREYQLKNHSRLKKEFISKLLVKYKEEKKPLAQRAKLCSVASNAPEDGPEGRNLLRN